jgi:mono/diheme cytochrome c family protein
MKIHPLFITAAPIMVLVSCTQSNVSGRQNEPAQTVQLQQPSDPPAASAAARTLFLKNCAHCHGADGHGDDGPDLHNLDWTDQQIVKRIRNGKAGQMTAFAGKLQPDEINSLVAYVRTLK